MNIIDYVPWQTLARHVMNVHLSAQTQTEGVEGEIPLATFKKYIAYARRLVDLLWRKTLAPAKERPQYLLWCVNKCLLNCCCFFLTMSSQQMWPSVVGRRCREAEEQIRANEERRQGAREGDGQTAVHPHYSQVVKFIVNFYKHTDVCVN